jgi:hypothetical protein
LAIAQEKGLKGLRPVEVKVEEGLEPKERELPCMLMAIEDRKGEIEFTSIYWL